MKRIVYLSVLIVLVSSNVLVAQGIRGYVRTQDGRPVSFASVYVAVLKRGTTANNQGEFQLALPAGRYGFQVQYLGYQAITDSVDITDSWLQYDIVLAVQHYNLAEVIITATGEDPAYYIMRKAIGMSQYYRNQIAEYKAKVYLKGSGRPTKIPSLLRKQLKEDGIEEGKLYVTETISEVSYSAGRATQTTVLATQSAGLGNDAVPMQFITLSLYNDINGIISPLSRDAFAVYKFKLEGSFFEDGYTINKIAVIPKRKGHDLYKGYLYIREASWSIYSVDLQIEQTHFAAHFKQIYKSVLPHVWLPVSHDYTLKLSFMGIKAVMTYLAGLEYSDLQLNPNLDHAFYFSLFDREYAGSWETVEQGQTSSSIKTEIYSEEDTQIESLIEKDALTNREMRQLNKMVHKSTQLPARETSLEIKTHTNEISDSARLRSTEYWTTYRTIPLTGEEQTNFKLDEKHTSDSTDQRRSLIHDMLFGIYAKKLTDQTSITYPGLLSLPSFEYNTVDGFVYSQSVSLKKRLKHSRSIQTDAELGYAFGRKSWSGKADIVWDFNPLTRSALRMSAGKLSQDYNTDKGMSRLINSAASLLLHQNYLKLYENRFVDLMAQTDILNGWSISLHTTYSRAKALDNTTTFAIFNPFDKEFTINRPMVTVHDAKVFDDHDAFVFQLHTTWTPRHYYRIHQGRKEMMYSRYPSFSLSWKQGVTGILGSTADFQQIEFAVSQTLSSRLYGNLRYLVVAGGFPSSRSLYFEHYKQWEVRPLWIDQSPVLTTFFGLSHYERSIAGSYAALFVQHSHSRILLKRIPALASSLMRESVFIHAHTAKGYAPYIEVGYGLQQLFLLLDLQLFTGFEKGKLSTYGLRLGIPIDGGVIQF